MISNELLEEIISISLNGKFINKKILQKVFDEVFLGLDEYTKQNFNRFEITEIFSLNNTVAACNPKEGIIKFDIYESYYVESENKHLSMLSRNLNIINNLLHEMEHLKEPYKITKNNFEAKILKNSIEVSHNKYKDLYDYIPAEKIASADSWKKLLQNILYYPNFKQSFFEEYKFINNQYIKNLKLGYYFYESYEVYNIPLFYYLDKIGQNKILNEVQDFWLNNIDTINTNDKLKYGLPITKQDMRIVNKQIIKTKSIK